MRRFYLDTSVFITLARISYVDLVDGLDGDVIVPDAVVNELYSSDDIERPAEKPELTQLNELAETGVIRRGAPDDLWEKKKNDKIVETAAQHLGVSLSAESSISGDIALVALGMAESEAVVVTDDKPLRKTCKALGIPVSGSIGVLIAAVERDDLDPEAAKAALLAMDEVGARLSASLLRRAERLIDEAAQRD